MLVLCVSVSVHLSLKQRVTKLLEAISDLSAMCREKQTFTIALTPVDKLKLPYSRMCWTEGGSSSANTKTENLKTPDRQKPSRKCCEAKMQVNAGLSINPLLFIKH